MIHQSSLKHCDRIPGLSSISDERRTAFSEGLPKPIKDKRSALRSTCAIDSRPNRDHPRITLLLGTLNLLAQFAVRYRLALSDEPQRLGNEAHGPPTIKPYVSIPLAQRYSEGIPQRNSSRARRFARDVNARHIKVVIPKYFETYCVE